MVRGALVIGLWFKVEREREREREREVLGLKKFNDLFIYLYYFNVL